MKKHIIYFLTAVSFLSACRKDSLTRYEVEKSFPDPNVSFDNFKKAIAGGPDGFRLIIQPVTGSSYGGFIKFDASSSAKYVLDNSNANAATAQDLKYSLTLSQSNSVLGLGKNSSFAVFANSVAGVDTSYTVKSLSGDTIKLSGNFSNTKLILVKAAKADADEYLAGKMATAITSIDQLNNFPYYYKRLNLGGKSYDLVINTRLRYITFNSLNGTTFQTGMSGYTYSNNGIVLNNAFTDGTTKINDLSKVIVTANSASGTSGSSAFTVDNLTAATAYDVKAATNFYLGGSRVVNNTGTGASWISYTGFTVNGVRDAFGVTTITGFNYLSFTPRYNAAYDRLGFFAGGAIQAYGPAIPTTIKTNGTIAFSYLGTFGTPPVAYTNIVNNTRIQITDAQGYYVIQNGPNQFDLVNVKDGKSWISFE